VNRGQLIAFEGIDGCGKSTQVARLAASLRAAGRSVVATREPTDGIYGRRIRAAAQASEPISPDDELHWFLQDRREHVAEILEPALAAGEIVITDRYYLSTVAYQGARGCGAEEILAASEEEFPLPDLAVLFVLDPARGLARVRSRGVALEGHFEHAAFQEAVAEIFNGLQRPYLARIDASPGPDEVAQAVAECVRARLGLP
jgi:dTMP kinase